MDGALERDGYVRVDGILDGLMVRQLREITDGLIAEMSEEETRRQRTTGSMIPVVLDPRLARLVAHPPAIRAVEALGHRDVRFQSGYIISKPPSSPPLFWHFDWGYWNHPISRSPRPAQIFLMYYLTDTSRENGCLRVIPGSHVRDNSLHSLLAAAHSADLAAGADLRRVEFQSRPDEVDVPVRAGDVVIGDARILHAAHANSSDRRRTVITLWYHPDFEDLPPELRAGFLTRRDPLPPDWPDEARGLYESVLIRYDGPVAPLPFSRDRPPLAAPHGHR